jgi:seryl-tRNA synthetase
MLDPHDLRTRLDFIKQRLATRLYDLDITQITALESQRKVLQQQTQTLQQQCNQQELEIGRIKAQGKEIGALLTHVADNRNTLERLELELKEVLKKISGLYATIPNLPHVTVPIGTCELDNVVIRKYGEPKRFSFEPKDHVALGERLQGMDFVASTKISGSRFVVLKGQLARLQRALIQFMLDTHLQSDYQEVYVPYIVNTQSLYGTGQLPKFKDDQFEIIGDEGFYLIPTSEVPMTNLARDHIFDSHELPKKYVCHTPCFRRESGSYGRDTRGMIRQHQFEKVELVWFTLPERSYLDLEQITQDAEMILQALQLPYRVVSLCSGDLGFSAAKTYDLEVWLPSQNTYREISSVSNFEAFQARRIQARWRDPKTKKITPIHTLNGSALAVGRTLVALLENNQDEHGNIHLPEALFNYYPHRILSVSSGHSKDNGRIVETKMD